MLLSKFKIFSTSVMLLGLSACGFQPLYSPQIHTTQDMADVKIATISDRDGQVLRNHLLDLLNPYGVPCKPNYTLHTKLTTTAREIGIRRDATTSRKELIATAAITLKDNQTGRVLLTRSIIAKNSYSALDTNYYTNVVTQEYAKEEAFRDLAFRIQLALAEFFAKDK